MPLPILDYCTPGAQTARPPVTVLEKCVWVALGVVLPVVCFGIAAGGYPMEPDWQSGQWNCYVSFIPDGRAGFPFYPLLLYSMGALCLFVARPQLSRLLAVRLALYTGIILGLQYTLIQAAFFQVEFPLAVLIGLASNFVLLGIVVLLNRIPGRILIYLVVGTAIVLAVLTLADFAGSGSLRLYRVRWTGDFLPGAGIVSLLFAPAWFAGVYTRAALLARKLSREPDNVRPRTATIVAWIAWLAGYAVAWKWSIINAVALYYTLPTQPPGCYIATAAAAGHRRFVGSAPARAADGSTFPANRQLRRLKCVEIALATVCPAGHRLIRRVYDFVGPPLARRIARHPLLADIAFATLKPVEWLTFGLLVAMVPEVRSAYCLIFCNPTPPDQSSLVSGLKRRI